MHARDYFEQIKQIPGLEEIKAVITQWNHVAENRPKLTGDLPIALPDLFWRTQPGAGKTHFLQLLSDYLDAARLMEFHGETKYFEFTLEYCPPQERMTELTRLIYQTRDAAGFRSHFCGLIAIDISAWADAFTEPHFRLVLEYLSSVNDRILVVFIAENLSGEALERAERLLNAYFRIRAVDFAYPGVDAFLAYCLYHFSRYGLTLAPEATALLKNTLAALVKSPYFDGYKTVNRLCQDVNFELCSIPNVQENPIQAAYLSAFGPDSSLVKNLCENAKVRSIGFGGNV